MSLHRKLFKVWCGLTILLLLLGIIGGDASQIALKFRVGGWRAAYVQFALAAIMLVGIPLTLLFVGRAAFWVRDQFRAQ
jgi:hypothetical protein